MRNEHRREGRDLQAPRAAEGPERLQKLLARAGYGSRRACEEIITGGHVTIDGAVVTELGTKADPAVQQVRVDGQRLRAEQLVYYLLNKPKSVVSTSDDPQRRRTVLDLIPERRRIFPVGRLDYESRGALILTNDGRLTNLLTHPRYGIEKTYHVRVRGTPTPDALERLRTGVWLSEGRTLPARVWVIKQRDEETELGVALSEGKNRQVRRMFAKVGYKVLGLTRTRIGPLTLKGLPDGAFRELSRNEVEMLRRIASRNAAEAPPAGRGRGRASRARSLGKPDPANPPVFGDPTVFELPREDDHGATPARPRARAETDRGRARPGRAGGRGRDAEDGERDDRPRGGRRAGDRDGAPTRSGAKPAGRPGAKSGGKPTRSGGKPTRSGGKPARSGGAKSGKPARSGGAKGGKPGARGRAGGGRSDRGRARTRKPR